MAIASLTFNACSVSSDSQDIYYGKTLQVTGTPFAGSGWILYNNTPLAGTDTSVSISGLDDNVDYTFYRYCHCPLTGLTDPEILGPVIKTVCPSFTSITPSFDTVSYILNVPLSANNAGSWIERIIVDLLDSTGTVVLFTNTHVAPFPGSISSSFTALTGNTTYKIRVKYSKNDNTRQTQCLLSTVTTTVGCLAPVVTIDSIGSTSFNINYSPSGGPQSGDTYNIVLNGQTIASGLPTGSTPFTVTGLSSNTFYTVDVVRNCGGGGSNTASASATTTQVNTVTADSTMAGITVSSISGISGFTLLSPLSPSGSATGTHNAFTGAISSTLGGTLIINPSNISIYRNGILIQCILVTSIGTKISNPFTFAVNDTIDIRYNTGSCT